MSQSVGQSAPPGSQPGGGPAAAPAPAVDAPQPTVRVMRLYKPVMHIGSPAPHLVDITSPNAKKPSDSDFALSNFFMLPDSFGDIYLGETFSAYVSVVNGTAEAFHNVTLSIRLQTMTQTQDLTDIRPLADKASGFAAVLAPTEFTDCIVQQPLNVVGTHTLRVSVLYTDGAHGEPKTLRKFYKFNVMNPITISTSALDLGNRYVVQSVLSNSTRSLLHIEHVHFNGNRELSVRKASETVAPEGDLVRLVSMATLGPDEKFAEGFMLGKSADFSGQSLGFLEIKWSTTMGEHGFIRSDDVLLPPSPQSITDGSSSVGIPGAPIQSPPAPQRVGRNSKPLAPAEIVHQFVLQCIEFPEVIVAGSVINLKIRVFNRGAHPATIQLKCANPGHSTEGDAGLLIVGASTRNLGSVEAGRFTDATVQILPVSPGLHDLNCVSVIDVATKKQYCAGLVLTKFLVKDSLQ